MSLAHGTDLWRARALIDIKSLHHNISRIRSITNNSAAIMAVVKADAYGHGLSTITEAITDVVDGFAVATLSEGIQCRMLQDAKPIVVLSEFWDGSQLAQFEQYDLQPVVHSLVQLRWLKDYAGEPLSVWIKFDTGMNRLGIDPVDVIRVYAELNQLHCVNHVRILSHLANADIEHDQYTLMQLKKFEDTTAAINCDKSLANSAGLCFWQQTHFDWVRPGLVLYGANPMEHFENRDLNLMAVMELQARIIAIKNINKGQHVGYGGVFKTDRKTRLAMVGLGYGDGYPRQVDGEACVLIKDQRAPIIGRISMDIITVDITDIEQVQIGEIVILWGEKLKVEEVARWSNTIPYELLCKVTPRIPRIIVNRES